MFGTIQFRRDDSRNLLRDFVLKIEEIFYVTVIAFRPYMMAGVRIDQLSGNANTVARFSYASLYDVPCAKVFADFSNIG